MRIYPPDLKVHENDDIAVAIVMYKDDVAVAIKQITIMSDLRVALRYISDNIGDDTDDIVIDESVLKELTDTEAYAPVFCGLTEDEDKIVLMYGKSSPRLIRAISELIVTEDAE